jgi:spore germination protein GerM
LGDGHLRPITRMLERTASPTQVIRSLTQEVSDAEASQGLRSALGSDVDIRSATVHRGTAIVDFGAAPELVGEDRILAVGQIVCTLAYQPGIGQVSFTVAGAPVQVPTDDGSLTSDPVTIDDYSTIAA